MSSIVENLKVMVDGQRIFINVNCCSIIFGREGRDVTSDVRCNGVEKARLLRMR